MFDFMEILKPITCPVFRTQVMHTKKGLPLVILYVTEACNISDSFSDAYVLDTIISNHKGFLFNNCKDTHIRVGKMLEKYNRWREQYEEINKVY